MKRVTGIGPGAENSPANEEVLGTGRFAETQHDPVSAEMAWNRAFHPLRAAPLRLISRSGPQSSEPGGRRVDQHPLSRRVAEARDDFTVAGGGQGRQVEAYQP